jgi:hypothetical protein
MVLATGNCSLKHPVRLIAKIVIFPPGGHDLEMSLNLAVTHGVVFKLLQLTIGQYVRYDIVVFSGYFHGLLGAFLYVFGDPLYYQGLFPDFEASLFAGSINFLKAFLELVQREDLGTGVGDAR